MRASLSTLAIASLLFLSAHRPAAAQQPPATPAVPAVPAADGDVDAAPGDDPDATESASTKVPLDEIRRLVSVYNAVREAYVEPVEDKALMRSAIRGLLLDLDPHSAYLERQAADAFEEDTSGAYDGIGVEVMPLPDGSVRVIAAIDGTPAARAGLRSGDVIVAVDGKALTPASREGAGPLRGAPGTSVQLSVLREGNSAPLEMRIAREKIRVASVRSRMLEPGFGYVRVSQFQADTAADFQRALQGLQREAGGALRGLVLDLRSNPGGLLTSAVQIADDLLERGGIVSTRGRIGISDAQFSATPGDRLEGAPVVVIVDAGSASASEVLAGALRDNGRARIVGSRSFGKGSVQTVLPLDNGDSVKLTTARYYTPSGRSIQARGIEPDVVLKPQDGSASRADFTEAMLPGHLRGDNEEAGGNAGDVLEGDAPIVAALAELKAPGRGAAAAAAAAAAKPATTDAGTTAPEAASATGPRPAPGPTAPAATTPVTPPGTPPSAAPPAPPTSASPPSASPPSASPPSASPPALPAKQPSATPPLPATAPATAPPPAVTPRVNAPAEAPAPTAVPPSTVPAS